MADFPTFAGLASGTVRSGPSFDVKTARARSGRRTSATWQATGIYRWRIAIGRLSRDLAGDELATLVNFVNARKGGYESFNFTCPLDGVTRTVVLEGDVELSEVVSRISEATSITLVSVP